MPRHSLVPTHPAWPVGFSRMPESARPTIIHFEGDISLMQRPAIAIVGTRHPSTAGVQIAGTIARYFASRGYVIVSGLAEGIDTAAHRGALSVAGGKTIAILGTPLSQAYPQSNVGLQQQIAECGLLLTEYTTRARDGQRFIVRDRLQAGLSCCVIPIQTGVRGGTQHTIGFAREYGRPLFVPVPQSVSEEQYTHPEWYGGINELVRVGDALPFEKCAEIESAVSLLHQQLVAGESLIGI